MCLAGGAFEFVCLGVGVALEWVLGRRFVHIGMRFVHIERMYLMEGGLYTSSACTSRVVHIEHAPHVE